MNVLKLDLMILLKISNNCLLILVMIAYGFQNLVILSLLVQSKVLTKFTILFFNQCCTTVGNKSSILEIYSLYKKTIHSSNLREENCQDYHVIGFKQSPWVWECIDVFVDIMCYFSILITESTLRNLKWYGWSQPSKS